MQEKKFERIIISRTDSIGDVMLTLPMCGVLKKFFPHCKISFLGRSYTRAIINSCIYADDFLDWDEIKMQSPIKQIEILSEVKADVIIHAYPRKEIVWLAKRANILLRIATGNRLFTVTKCNRLVFFTRKNSPLHEAQLNLKLLKPLGIEPELSKQELEAYFGFQPSGAIIPFSFPPFENKTRIVLHPLSKGSAIEWGLENYQRLIEFLSPEKFEVYITGTKEEGEQILSQHPLSGKNVSDLTGKFTLEELIDFIGQCDVMVAASTGPLHIAAVLGKVAIGLFSPKRPIHAGRWAPIGKNVQVISSKVHPHKGEKLAIEPGEVFRLVEEVLQSAVKT
ncbi:MAG: glycosyltransferase family 9 protein [Flavobacteriales bacterium]|nr:glycosyltransferase family 9 protein [Flavobacteriales bacterium]